MSHYKPDPDKSVNLTINGFPVTVPEGTTILEAARKVNVKIPTLCDHPDLCRRAVCRVCVVECDGRGKLVAACANDVWEGVNVVTHNARIIGIRRMIVELLLANHPQDCLTCAKNRRCDLQSLAENFGIRESPFRREARDLRLPEKSGQALVRDMAKCVKCGRCVEACQEVQAVRALNTSRRSVNYEISTPFAQTLEDGPCVFCGQCAEICPVGAIYENDQSAEVWADLNDKERKAAVQIAPSLAADLAGALGFAPETLPMGKIVTALKTVGFDKVYDGDLFAALAAREEEGELLNRLRNRGKLPLISACFPGWGKFIEEYYPGLQEHLSGGKSPEEIFGALVKTNSRQVLGIEASKVTSVSIVPCLAKKFVPDPGKDGAGFNLTLGELCRLFKRAGVDFTHLPETPFDTAEFGAAGNSGALDTTPSKSPEGNPGIEALRMAELSLAGTKVKVQTVYGLAKARAVLDAVARGQGEAALIKVMSCPGGCGAPDR